MAITGTIDDQARDALVERLFGATISTLELFRFYLLRW